MSLKVWGITGQKDLTKTATNYPQATMDGDKVIAQRGTIQDITGTVEKLGLNSASDIIFNGTNAVAVEQYRMGRLSPIVVLKVTGEADSGLHELVVAGYGKNGQLTSIELRVDVNDN